MLCPPAVIEFGRRVQEGLVTREQARSLARTLGIPLLGLGGQAVAVVQWVGDHWLPPKLD